MFNYTGLELSLVELEKALSKINEGQNQKKSLVVNKNAITAELVQMRLDSTKLTMQLGTAPVATPIDKTLKVCI